ncbi:ABC transporter ATP-binding protein [Alphaproteobacteria bacterium]|nr:ABC transporter ATP-binding protein [Alphaproteobacteria bacterium]MDA9164700.1 ABC transporter ATP-binding protein [Alphaproteobacteria bacterium]
MSVIISVENLVKVYGNEFPAVKNLNLNINKGEIIALLGPNGAGKTTLISTICGLASITSGTIKVNNLDVIKDYRKTREIIGLVPQELALEPFEKVMNAVRFSRRLFGKKDDNVYLDKLLTKLQLFEKKNNIIKSLSGGMKRRVMIAKALSHNPQILFLDEPTAGVDVELRKDMWNIIKELKAEGVTIILTTHYIEEAEMIADRIGIINKGELLLVEEKNKLIKRMSVKTLKIKLKKTLTQIPKKLNKYNLKLIDEGNSFHYFYNTSKEKTGITSLLYDMNEIGINLFDIQTEETSLEEIFVKIIKD